jgi:hypothetical protein
LNSLNGNTPVAAAPPRDVGAQLAANLPRAGDGPTTRTSLTVPRAVAEEPAGAPAMPVAPNLELAVPPPPVPTMAPAPVVLQSPAPPPPITVRQ